MTRRAWTEAASVTGSSWGATSAVTDVMLVYPYFYRQAKDRSIFKFPPLGLGYLAAALMDRGLAVEIVDGTFSNPAAVVERVKKRRPSVLGFYVMVTMEDAARRLAAELAPSCQLLVAGGPYPSCAPELFAPLFDLVAVGEGEESLPALAKALVEGEDPRAVPGFAFSDGGAIRLTGKRDRIERLDEISFPARSLFDHQGYQRYWRENYGYTTTSLLTTRGCPFHCGFCSKPIFGDLYKERSAKNVVDELECVLSYGYDRVWIADDCFTLNQRRVLDICDLILARGLKFEWECLSRVDQIKRPVLGRMREAGCKRVFFGLESGNDAVLGMMRKDATVAAGRQAVDECRLAGLDTGGFFILGYPGETARTLLDTVNFSSQLPLDYLSYTVPYPLPGTDLFERVKDRMNGSPWSSPRRHRLLYQSEFSILRLKAAMAKGLTQHTMRTRLGRFGSTIEPVFERATDALF